MYLRYYFRRPWWQVLVLGFCLTLSFETLQLTGLLGIYEHPYRLFDVDDLIVNTLGAMVGFWLVGPALRVLPDVRLVNAGAREAGVHASVTRRALSFGIDLVLAQLGAGVVSLLVGPAAVLGASLLQSDVAWDAASQATETLSLALFFVAVPTLTRGQTLGQKLLRLRIVRPDARQAGWYQYAGRYGLLFLFAWAPFGAVRADGPRPLHGVGGGRSGGVRRLPPAGARLGMAGVHGRLGRDACRAGAAFGGRSVPS